MPRYNVNHGYRSYSDGRQFGPFVAGETVELDEREAEWVERDSPGCLTPVDGDDVQGDDDAPAQPNRQHKPAKKRAAS